MGRPENLRPCNAPRPGRQGHTRAYWKAEKISELKSLCGGVCGCASEASQESTRKDERACSEVFCWLPQRVSQRLGKNFRARWLQTDTVFSFHAAAEWGA